MSYYRRLVAALALAGATAVGAVATPLLYTVFHALEEDTLEVFTSGGSGSVSLSLDGGQSYQTVSTFTFDAHGRAVAEVAGLNRGRGKGLVRIEASFNEGTRGQPLDTVSETTVRAFVDSLSRYRRLPWLTYAPIYVAYPTLPDLVDTAIAAGGFDALVAAVQAAGLEDALRGPGPFTVFAPTDAAFEALAGALGATVPELLELPNLADILLYHVVPGALDADAVAAAELLETLLGKDVTVRLEADGLYINDSKVVLGNIEASNGIIHVIDAVLLPPVLPDIVETARGAGIFTTLVAALEETGLDAALAGPGPFTVFAPTDDAFAALGIPAGDLLADPGLADILLYHVVDGRLKASDVVALDRIATLAGKNLKVKVSGGEVFINDAKIVLADIKAENGIVHVIDAVLVPSGMPDIVDTAIAAGQFSTLVGALQATGLDEALRGDGPFTVFAPTDEAFARLPKWLLNFLVRNPRYLEQVLLYHVVEGDLDAAEVVGQGTLPTLLGQPVRARQRGSNVFINNAKVVAADVEAENGTIHVIDKVLLPWLRH